MTEATWVRNRIKRDARLSDAWETIDGYRQSRETDRIRSHWRLLARGAKLRGHGAAILLHFAERNSLALNVTIDLLLSA